MLETINLDGGLTNAGQSLAPFGSLFTQSGILRPNSFTVSALDSPGMFVEVSGSNDDDLAILKTIDGATYFVRNTLPLQVPILTNSSGVTKTDAIVLMVDLSAGDEENAGSPGAAQIIAVRRDGVSTGLPTDGEIDAQTGNNPWIFLKQVEVTHNTGEIEEGDVTGTPDQAPLGLQIVATEVITTALLAALAVTEAKIAVGAVSNVKLKTGAGEPGGEWQDYSSVATITGWSSTTVKELYGKIVGKTFMFRVYVAGTSNATTATMKMPFKMKAAGFLTVMSLARTTDNGTATTTGGYMNIDADTDIMNFRPNHNPASTWTASGNKILIGSGEFEIA